MRKLLILFSLICYVGATNAQMSANMKNCRFEVNRTDEFTGEKILVTTSAKMNRPAKDNYRFAFSFANIIDRDNLLPPSKFMTIKLSSVNQSLYIAKDNELLIKLNNNEIIELKAADDYKTQMTPAKKGLTYTHVEANYQTSNEDLKKIKEIGISKIMMNTCESQFDMDLKVTDNRKISDMLICVVDV